MANTYTLIDKAILTGNQGSVTFSSIPSTYTDLKFIMSARTDGTASTTADTYIAFNGSTSGYTNRYVRGNGASASSSTIPYTTVGIYVGEVNTSTSTTSTFSNSEAYIPNYTSANNKSVSTDVVQEANGTTAYAQLNAGLWSNTAAITSIVIQNAYGYNFVSGSSFYIYGIKNS